MSISISDRPVFGARLAGGAGALLPGLLLCLGVSAAALGLARAEAALTGRAWLEALVLAILLGTAIRTAWSPSARWAPGIRFSAKSLLEVAVVLLGATVSARAVLAAGPALLAGIAGVVAVAICASYALGRLLRLPHRMAMLVACGNAICGNSAIAAVAPVIDADGEEVSAAIAYTAVLGVIVVLLLPLAVPLLHLSGLQYGALAGLTVYAVPQVLAATAPVGAVAVQFGTLVKLMRVLMLGPVVLALSLLSRRAGGGRAGGGRPAGGRAGGGRVAGGRAAGAPALVPWFIIGFLALAAAASLGWVPAPALGPVKGVADGLTVISMAALGLGTDLRLLARAGLRVTAAVTLSLLALGGLSLALMFALLA